MVIKIIGAECRNPGDRQPAGKYILQIFEKQNTRESQEGEILLRKQWKILGVNTAFLILILVQSIKDFKKTKYTRAFVVTIVLMAGSLLINLYARLQNSF